MKELRAEAAQAKEIGAMEAAREGVKEFGGMMKDIGGKLWDGLQPMAEHGAHEMASAMFRGDAFVLYPRNAGKEAQSMEGQSMDDLRSQAKEMANDRSQEQTRDRGMER